MKSFGQYNLFRNISLVDISFPSGAKNNLAGKQTFYFEQLQRASFELFLPLALASLLVCHSHVTSRVIPQMESLLASHICHIYSQHSFCRTTQGPSPSFDTYITYVYVQLQFLKQFYNCLLYPALLICLKFSLTSRGKTKTIDEWLA